MIRKSSDPSECTDLNLVCSVTVDPNCFQEERVRIVKVSYDVLPKAIKD